MKVPLKSVLSHTGVMLMIVGTTIFFLGFHSIDSYVNHTILINAYDGDPADWIDSSGKRDYTIDETYILGVNWIFYGFFITMLGAMLYRGLYE